MELAERFFREACQRLQSEGLIEIVAAHELMTKDIKQARDWVRDFGGCRPCSQVPRVVK